MKMVYKQFMRANLPFIKCEYEILSSSGPGSSEHKLCQYLMDISGSQ